MSEYAGSIELISGITPKNGGKFPLVNDEDVLLSNGARLSELQVNGKKPDESGNVSVESGVSAKVVGKKLVIGSGSSDEQVSSLSYFGVPYSSAEEIIPLNEEKTVHLYLFATNDGYDAVVSGTGEITDYLYTDATYTDSHTDNRPYNAENITRLHIEDGITSIGNYFMYRAYNLKILTFANIGAITHLSTNAFSYTQIGGKYNFSGLTDTKLDAPFMACPKLKGVTFGGAIKEVAERSFQMCIALQYVNGLSVVTKIEDAAFQYCTSLESLDVTPGNVTLGDWVFILTPPTATIEGTETALSAAGWKSQGSLCFVPNEWTAEQLAAIRAETGESVQFPIPESDNQGTEFYKHWMVFPRVRNGEYKGIEHPASGCCGIFSLFHIYNIIHPDAPFDTFYDWMMRGVVPNKIKVTQSLYDTLTGCEYGQALIAGNTAVPYDVGSEITAMDLPMSLDADSATWGTEGTSFWGCCEALDWSATRIGFDNSVESGATVKQAILDSLANEKPVMMEIVGAADEGHGMHAVVAIGYDAKTDRFLIIDSTGGFDADVVPLVYWVSFESLITPNETSAIWTFDFGEAVTLTDIDNKLDFLMASVNSGYHTESGTFDMPDAAANTPIRIPFGTGAKLFFLEADEETTASIVGQDATYTLGFYAVFSNVISERNAMPTFWHNAQYAYGSSVATNTDGITLSFTQAFKGGTYRYKAYYWNE